jgi:hypothetical protein
MGTLSPYPWDLSLLRQNGCLACGAAGAAPSHSGRWVGAPVASLRCRIFRPGRLSISRATTLSEKMIALATIDSV